MNRPSQLAKRIDLSQVSEIELMRSWFEACTEAVPDLHRVHGHAHRAGLGRRMPGMLTEAQLDRMAAARRTLPDHGDRALVVPDHRLEEEPVEPPPPGRRGGREDLESFRQTEVDP